jgi:predicted enzyme related to lactoylglutathione lyase
VPTTTTSGIHTLNLVIVPVNDQDRMIAFYEDVLGLQKRADIPMGESYRWVEVAVPGAETGIALAPPAPGGSAGGMQTGIALTTADIEATHAHLRGAGADVDDAISRMGDPVPPMFWFRDPEENVLLVVEGEAA